MGKDLYKIYNRSAERYIANLKAAEKTKDIRVIHCVRTELKKLRIIHILLNKICPIKFKNKEFNSSIKELFVRTGKLREIQINLLIIGKYKTTSTGLRLYKKHLLEEEELYINKFEEAAKEFDFTKFQNNNNKLKRVCDNLSKPDLSKKTERYLENKIRKIKEKRAGKNRYHDIRIDLKTLLILTNILNKINGENKNKKQLKRLKGYEIELGKWHDREVFINSVDKFLNGKAENTYGELRCLIEKMKERNRERVKGFEKLRITNYELRF